MLNLEAYMAEEAGARDMVTDSKYNQLLSTKAQRYTGGSIAQLSKIDYASNVIVYIPRKVITFSCCLQIWL